MDISIHVDFNDLAQFRHLFEVAPSVVLEEYETAVLAETIGLRADVQDKTPVGASRGAGEGLMQSIRYRMSQGINDITGTVYSNLSYAEPVEFGTRPHRPPVEPLLEWAEVKLGLKGLAANRAAWGVARKIERQGTKGAFMFTRSFAEQSALIEARLRGVLPRVVTRLESAL